MQEAPLQLEVPGGTLTATAARPRSPGDRIRPPLFGVARDLTARDLTTHAADAAAVLHACGPPATLAGWSIGAVLEVATTYPELVEGIVLLEPPLHERHPRPRKLSAIVGTTLLGRAGRPEAGARRFLRWALGRRDGSSDLDRMPPEWHHRLAAGDAAAVVSELAAGTGEHLDAELLRRIDTPAHVLRGDPSQWLVADAARRTAHALNDAALVDVPASGHAIQLDAPRLLADSVAALRTAAPLVAPGDRPCLAPRVRDRFLARGAPATRSCRHLGSRPA